MTSNEDISNILALLTSQVTGVEGVRVYGFGVAVGVYGGGGSAGTLGLGRELMCAGPGIDELERNRKCSGLQSFNETMKRLQKNTRQN